MALLSHTDRQRVEAAIRAAEARTSGEFVTVIARASDVYLFIPVFYGALAAFAVPLIPWTAGLATGFLPLFAVQLVVFAAAVAVLRWTRAGMWLIPRSVQRQRAARLAREQFYAQGLHETKERTGILLFVSIAERRVEILADKGIDEKVAPGAWDAIVADFTAKVRAGRAADGFVAAVEACGTLLAEHFPRGGADKDELPDVLIEI